MFSNKIYKNNQVNVGIPLQIRSTLTYQPPAPRIKVAVVDTKQQEVDDTEKVDCKAIYEEMVSKAKSESDLIIKEALLEAKDIVSQSYKEVEEIKNQALEAARQEGYNLGLSQAEHKYSKLLEEAQNIKAQAELEYKQLLDSLEEDAVNTILGIAKKVISQELKCKENLFLLVKDAFEKCSKDHKAVLKLSESDFEYVNEHADELTTVLERSEEVEIKKDLSLKEGGCIIETPYGSIDASTETKFEKIENDFKNMLDQAVS